MCKDRRGFWPKYWKFFNWLRFELEILWLRYQKRAENRFCQPVLFLWPIGYYSQNFPADGGELYDVSAHLRLHHVLGLRSQGATEHLRLVDVFNRG